jgi:nucleotide-binding universal stress UspA family protein
MQELNTKAVKVLTQFANHFDSELHVLHVLSGNDNLTPEQASIFKEQFSGAANYPSLSYHILDAGDKSVSASIEEFVDSNGASAVALVTHHRSFFDKLFHPSLTKRLAVHAHKPLLAFHG